MYAHREDRDVAGFALPDAGLRMVGISSKASLEGDFPFEINMSLNFYLYKCRAKSILPCLVTFCAPFVPSTPIGDNVKALRTYPDREL